MSDAKLVLILCALVTLGVFLHTFGGLGGGAQPNQLKEEGGGSSSADLRNDHPVAPKSTVAPSPVAEVGAATTLISAPSIVATVGVGVEEGETLLDPKLWCTAADGGYDAIVARVARLDTLLSTPSAPHYATLNARLFNVTALKASLGEMMTVFLGTGIGGLPIAESSSSDSAVHECYAKARTVVKARHEAATVEGGRPRRLFIDMGSRSGDQTQMFLSRFPEAAAFEVHCFEANPVFNKWYAANARPNLFYRNEAVGVVRTTMWLSDRDVGSSIVDGRGRDGSGVEVSVTDFSHFLLREAMLPKDRAAVEVRPPARVIVKMDIEKMEYSVLLKLFTTGAMLLIDDLLLECHYTTNARRGPARPAGAIGIDDCKDFIHALNVRLNGGAATTGGGVRRFEAVLWNSVKTAKSSGFSIRHGGFIPT